MNEKQIKATIKDYRRWFKNHFSMTEYKIIAMSNFTIVGYSPKGYNVNERNSFNKFKALTKSQVMELVA